MKYFHPAILILFVILFFIHPCYAWTGKVVGVSDGDTIKVLHDGKQVKIRLYGVDTPEKKQAYGKAAKKLTASLVAGKDVGVEEVTKDRYKRTVAIVSVDGELLNEELVRAGYAWVYKRYCKKPICSEWLDLESQARSSAIGLWADPNPQAPWKWRAGCKDDKNSSAVIPGVFHGNVKSKVFHQPDCKYYDCKNCTAGFITPQEAIQAGYKPCGICKP